MIVFIVAIHLLKKNKMNKIKNVISPECVLDEAVNYIDFIKSHLWEYITFIVCDKMKILYKYFYLNSIKLMFVSRQSIWEIEFYTDLVSVIPIATRE